MGRPPRSDLQVLYNLLHTNLYTIISSMRFTPHRSGDFICMYWGNDKDMKPLKKSCELVISLIDSIDRCKNLELIKVTAKARRQKADKND